METHKTSPLTAYDRLSHEDRRVVDAYVYREMMERISGQMKRTHHPALTADYRLVNAGIQGIVPQQPAGRGTASYNVEMHIEVMRDVVAANPMFLAGIRGIIRAVEAQYPGVDFTTSVQAYIDFNGDEFDAPNEISNMWKQHS
jgi:hypothetical protein